MRHAGRSIDFDRVAERYDDTRGGETRGRVVADAIEPWLRPGGPTLEVGVGTGVVASALRARGSAVAGVDLSRAMLARAHTRLGNVVALADAHALPVRSSSVGNVVVVWVLHTVADAGIVLGECVRVLRGGGRLVVSSGRPRFDDEIEAIDLPLRQRRPGDDGRDAVIARAEAAGFALVESGDVVVEFDQSPAELVCHIEDRVSAYLWDVDDATWSAEVQPVIDGLRALPDPARPRRRAGRHDLLVFERRF